MFRHGRGSFDFNGAWTVYSPGASALLIISITEAARFRPCGPVHLTADSAEDFDLVAGDAGAAEEAAQFAEYPLRRVRIEVADGQKALAEMGHEPLDLFLGCRLRRRWLRDGRPHVDRCDQNGNCLREVEDWKILDGGDSYHQITLVDVLSTETSGFISKDQGGTPKPSINKDWHRIARCDHRETTPSTPRCRRRQHAVGAGGIVKILPAATFETLISSARPPTDLRVVSAHSGADKFQSWDTEIGGHPHRGSEISGEGGFDEDHGFHRHRKI
jgi:hypothetical protein